MSPIAKAFLVFVVASLVYGRIYSMMSEEHFCFKDPTIDPYYFSFTTMSTAGYGDYAPKTRLAKAIVMSQMVMIMSGILSVVAGV